MGLGLGLGSGLGRRDTAPPRCTQPYLQRARNRATSTRARRGGRGKVVSVVWDRGGDEVLHLGW